ncbi:MAG: response regulator transcription factor [Gammaproteobacteria bacterium]|nr:response regulator transcription factor [Gammaproteobacteria bacterium]
MKVMIVDDEALARERLRRLLEEDSDVEVVAEAANGQEALTRCQSARPEVVLLDIRMPGMDGLEAARHMAELDPPPAVIFTTAYGDHALQAFEARAIDYLLKPIRRERLTQSLARARYLNRSQLSALDEARPEAKGRNFLSVHRHGSLQLIPVNSVVYFQADSKYVTVHHAEGEDLIDDSLRLLEDEFGGAFVRIHRNALVASGALKGIEKDNAGHIFALLQGTKNQLEISRRHVAEIRRLLKERSKSG